MNSYYSIMLLLSIRTLWCAEYIPVTVYFANKKQTWLYPDSVLLSAVCDQLKIQSHGNYYLEENGLLKTLTKNHKGQNISQISKDQIIIYNRRALVYKYKI